MTYQEYFQDFMPGDVCFGCGSENSAGLKIRSYWEGDETFCQWQADQRYQGWQGLTCGGIIATLIDCHCMATAMATALRIENRALNSEPRYRFATASLNIQYLKPTPIDRPLLLRAHVTEILNSRRYTLVCDVYSGDRKTAQAKVVAILVYRSDRPHEALSDFRIEADPD